MKELLFGKSKNEDVCLLLDYFCSYSYCEDNDKLFEYIDEFLVNFFEASSMLVFSYSSRLVKTEGYELSSTYRTVWNKKIIEKEYKKKEIFKVIKHISDNRSLLGEIEKIVIDQVSYYGFSMGNDENQTYFSVFKSVRDINCDILKLMAKFATNAFKNVQHWKKLQKTSSLAHIDDVTGLYNQRKLQKDLDSGIDRHKKFDEGFVILFIDIDHFKDINDGHGHLIGTKLLFKLGILLKDILRESDLIYRYGGDEFVMIVPNSNTEDGKIIGERILERVKNNIFEISAREHFRLSLSIGIARFPDNARNSSEIISIADQMMYYAKSTGRGKVCLAGEFFE